MAKGIFFLNSSGIYFNKETLKKFIETVNDSGLTSFCFHFSNGGDIRFRLDDMLIKTPYGEYDLSCAVGKDQNGKNKHITQKEMDELLDYANELGVEIIPSLDVPGHMKGILKYFPALCFEGTTDSINIKDPEAVAFAYAFVQKYADYFAQKGCRYFGIGADEFAQDLNNEMGFETIYTNGDMKYFVTFMNGIIERLANKGFEVMAFNDGICYADDTETYGKIDDRLIVLYWSPGWGRRFATPTFLEEQSYRVCNSYHTYYVDNNTRDFEAKLQIHENLDMYSMGGKDIKNPFGAMFCCWSIFETNPEDYPEKLSPLLHAFGKAFVKQNEKAIK